MSKWAKLLVVLALVIFCALVWYVFEHYSWAAVLPEVIPPGMKDTRIDAKVGVSSAVQETVGLLTTLLLAITALFAFAIGDKLEKLNNDMAISILLCALYSASLTIGALAAYENYRAIALQLDAGYLFIQPLSNLLARQTWCVVACVALALAAVSRRAAAVAPDGRSTGLSDRISKRADHRGDERDPAGRV